MNTIQIISIVAIVIAAIILIVYKIKKHGLRKTAIALIVKAEETFQNGEAKLEMVVSGFIAALKPPLNLIPASIVTKFIQGVFDEIKDALHSKGYKEQQISEETKE